MTRTVHVIPHTHWDREWYRTFQSFRMELVDLVDETLDLLERDPHYSCFMLDGQMAVVDDYLAIRPENRGRLETQARAGRLLMGPWYILMDEFLVSGETIIRDLALGLDRAEEFGGAMPLGYLPDMFGHIAQMPQILRGFGFDDTVVWRGVPSEVATRPSFIWEALDGSSVVAQYLPRGYGNGVGLPPSAADLVTRVELFCAQTGARSGAGDDPVLWMHGTDHRHPIPALPTMVAEANAAQAEWRFVVSSLPAYIAEQRNGGRPAATWRGELRSGVHANLLMGVGSNRVDVKQAAARAERLLEQLAEPLSALLLPAGQWPTAFLDTAWKLMILNAAHDSICACSHDDVVEAVRSRFAEASAIGEGLVERAMLGAAQLGHAAFGPNQPTDEAALVVNPSQRRRSGLVERTLHAGVTTDGSQLIRDRPGRNLLVELPASESLGWIDVVEDHLGDVAELHIAEGADGEIDVDLIVDPLRFGLLDTTAARQELTVLIQDRPLAHVRFWFDTTASRKVLDFVHDVPGFGWAILQPGPLPVPEVTVDGSTMRNGLVTVSVADNGTFALDGHAGLGRLVDEGDKGDTYNWCPPADGRSIDTADEVTITTLEVGPLRARIRIDARYRWPAEVHGENRVGEVATTVSTTLELQAAQDFVHVEVRFDNRSRDHRLRAWFPLPQATAMSQAECAFGMVERGLVAEGGPTEQGLATYPSRRFVRAGGLTVAHEGLLEYELVDRHGAGPAERANALALTLLRSTGLLSQAPMTTRALPAGPIHRLEGPQLQGPRVARYAVRVGDGDPYAFVDDAFVPLFVTGLLAGDSDDAPGLQETTMRPTSGGPELQGSLLDVTGAQVSSLRRLAGRTDVLELRVFNPTSNTVTVTVEGRTGDLVDLRGRSTGRFAGTCPLRPWGIQTMHLIS